MITKLWRIQKLVSVKKLSPRELPAPLPDHPCRCLTAKLWGPPGGEVVVINLILLWITWEKKLVLQGIENIWYCGEGDTAYDLKIYEWDLYHLHSNILGRNGAVAFE